MSDIKGERSKVRTTSRGVRIAPTNGADIYQGVASGEGSLGKNRDGGRSGILLGDDRADSRSHSSHPKHTCGPRQSTVLMNERRRYRHHPCVCEEDGWVRVEPCKKKVTRQT